MTNLQQYSWPVKIYALFNTKDKNVFYIGATKQPLKIRLQGHLSRSTYSKINDYMYESCSSGAEIEIFELDEVPFYEASFYESFYIDLYYSFGFSLIQMRHSNYCQQQNNKFQNALKVGEKLSKFYDEPLRTTESHLMPEVYAALQKLADKENRSLKNYIETVLQKHLEAQKKK